MGAMTCPSCSAELPPYFVLVRNVGICPSCLRTVAVDGYQARVAHGDDTTIMDDGEIEALKRLRKQARKAKAA